MANEITHVVDLSRGGSLRPQLENLTGEQVQRLAAEALAEARRRAIFLDENNTSAANDLYRALEERDVSKHAVAKEFNAQQAERMAVAWAERADALLKEKPDAPGVPVDPGRELDKILDAFEEGPRAALPWRLDAVLRTAFIARRNRVPTFGPLPRVIHPEAETGLTSAAAYRAWADDPDFDTRND